MPKRLILCNCLDSQAIDAAALETATSLPCSKVYRHLCGAQTDVAAEAIEAGDAIICCGQEQARFEELAEEIGAEAPEFLDLRDRAGWTEDTADTAPKMAALAAEGMLEAPVARSVDVISEGICLIFGSDSHALDLAAQLASHLSVTVLLSDPEALPVGAEFDLLVGRMRAINGALGGFKVAIDGLQQIIPGGRGAPVLSPPRDGGHSDCDIVIDLGRERAFVPAPEKREGYLRADPGRPGALTELALEAVQLTGTFEKPLYVRTEPLLCAHSRAGQTACSNCLDICPTGAITPAGEHVTVDPMICAGCGACSAVCPSGAISYDAPPVDLIFRRLRTLGEAFRKAGGAAPRLLVTDATHGPEMIRFAARYGRGLPADVIPMEVTAIGGFGHAEMMAALACGFAAVDVLLPPRAEREAPIRELALAESLAGPGRLRLLDLTDPDALSDALFDRPVPAPVSRPVLPMGTRRQVTRLAAKAVAPEAEQLPLPEGAPYGAVLVDTEACTLCLACVSLCPSGALGDNPDKPQLLFQEDACLQCGLCATICPEDAIALEPRMDLTDAAFSQRVLNEEEPFACIECGALFGVASTVERILDKLAGKHSMFGTSDTSRLIQMCDDCRIKTQYHSTAAPLSGGERPRPRTTDDYLSARKDH
ncbi:4Fe-4S binding protein [Poseidonocella sedimentorum]|uniref:4Fe-4S dicluster domain-containing protein n=1 Tax=Poseidonocella sedimentorum TaxID=871652 RepID=A0A1I6D3M8_9RHOB|nr:4Fe-4S binding protein [Poseidonocella sedimentorum]SFQ99952.1 4Fe-4S dicluster domain-containing protein [Poseidonocella sedimentorum]